MSLSYLIKFANYCDIKYKIKKLADLDPAAEPEIDLGAGPEVEDRAILNKGSLLMTLLFDKYCRTILEDDNGYGGGVFYSMNPTKAEFDKLVVNLLDFFKRNTLSGELLGSNRRLQDILKFLRDGADDRIDRLETHLLLKSRGELDAGNVYKIERGEKTPLKRKEVLELIELLKEVKDFCFSALEKVRDAEGFSRQTSFEKEVARSKRVDPDAISLDYLGTELDEFEDSPIREIWLGDEEDRFPPSK